MTSGGSNTNSVPCFAVHTDLGTFGPFSGGSSGSVSSTAPPGAPGSGGAWSTWCYYGLPAKGQGDGPASLQIGSQHPGIANITAYLLRYGQLGDGFTKAIIAQATLRVVFGSGAAEPTAKPTAQSPAMLIKSSAAYKAFLGLNDPVTQDWSDVKNRRAGDLLSTAVDFSERAGERKVPGEDPSGVHSAELIPPPTTDLYNLLCCDATSSSLERHDNVFAQATHVTQQELLGRILDSPGHLEPASLLKLALEVTHGSYPLAVLTTHNLLKDVALQGRNAIEQGEGVSGPRLVHQNLIELEDAASVVSKLDSMRENPGASADKIGPWYHAFAVLTAGAYVEPGAAGDIVLAEHGGKLLTSFVKFFKREGGFDLEKFRLDQSFATIAQSRAIARLSAIAPQR